MIHHTVYNVILGTLTLLIFSACNPLASNPTTSPSFQAPGTQLPSTGESLGSFQLNVTSHYKAAYINWSHSPGAQTYTLKRGTSPGSYDTVLSTDATSPYVDLKLSNGTTYYYMVEAKTGNESKNADAEAIANPVSQGGIWSPLSLTNSPDGYITSAAIANNGHKMVIWGGSKLGVGSVNSGVIYDSALNTWTVMQTTNAPTARYGAKAIWERNRIYIWGGTDSGGNVANGAVYDTETNTWTAMATNGAPSPRSDFSMAYVRGKIVVWGGKPDGVPANTFSDGAIYDPLLSTWSPMASGPLPLAGHFVAVADNKMVVSGGDDNTGANSTVMKIYDITTNTWSSPTASGAPSDGNPWDIYSLQNKILVNTRNNNAQNMWEYDPKADTWTALAAPTGSSIFFHHSYGTIYTFDSNSNSGTIYDYATNSWSAIPGNSGLTMPVMNEVAANPVGGNLILYGGDDYYGSGVRWLNQGTIFKP